MNCELMLYVHVHSTYKIQDSSAPCFCVVCYLYFHFHRASWDCEAVCRSSIVDRGSGKWEWKVGCWDLGCGMRDGAGAIAIANSFSLGSGSGSWSVVVVTQPQPRPLCLCHALFPARCVYIANRESERKRERQPACFWALLFIVNLRKAHKQKANKAEAGSLLFYFAFRINTADKIQQREGNSTLRIPRPW